MNSAAYDAALRQRGSLTVWFTDAALAAWKAEPQTTRGGQSRYFALAIATALMPKAVFRLALRQTEGLIGLLGLDLAVPDHTTLSRRAENLDVVRPRPGSGRVHLLVDSTSRFKRVVGDGLRSRTDRRRATKVAFAVTAFEPDARTRASGVCRPPVTARRDGQATTAY